MREEVISSATADAVAVGRSSSTPATPAASSAGATSPAAPANNIASIDWHGNTHGSKAVSVSGVGSQLPRTSLSTNAGGSTLGTSEPSCRPWERGDLLRRLATFKPSNWFAKPKGASSLSCARRGWINVDKDIIECESCGMQLNFTAPESWTSIEVDRAGETFADQLDSGHKITCLWRGNSCADSLAQFPPTPPSALIGGYKDRCDGLLQFFSLPIIASSAIEAMKLTRSTQIDRFLSSSHTLYSGELGCKADAKSGIKLSRDLPISTYSHAQKLISLCGWEPRWLPNIQDCEENSAESAKNACSVGPTRDEDKHSGFGAVKKSELSVKDKGKRKVSDKEIKCDIRSPLLDCSLCGATVRVWDFRTVNRPDHLVTNSIDAPDTGKKLPLTRGISAASGINGWIAPEVAEKEQLEGRDEAATNDEAKSLSNAGLDLNLTMAGGLPSAQFGMPVMSEHFVDGGMGRDLVIGQPAGSEVGDRAASYESRGPSTRKRNLEEGGSTVERPQDRIQHADSIEGTVIDREGDEVDDGTQESDGPSKRPRGFDIFDRYHSSYHRDSSGAGPSRNLNFDIDIDANRVDSFKEDNDVAIGHPSARESTRASSVIAMDTIYSSEDDSMESVENFPGKVNDFHFPSPSVHRNLDINDALDSNFSNQAQQSAYVQPAGGSAMREMGGSSTNEGEEIVNAETVKVYPRDRLSLGVSGGSVGMGASHEAEIHGVEVSVHRTESVVGDAEPIADVTENQGQTGESAPGPGLMDEFVPEEAIMQDRGDSQEEMSRSIGRADSGSKVCGSTKADSVETGEKVSHNIGHDSTAHPSLSCNAVIINSAYEASKEEVTQTNKVNSREDLALAESGYAPLTGTGLLNGENDFEAEAGEFDPIKQHNSYCPWVNGNVAAAGCNSDSGSSSSSSNAPCGWELTLDSLDAFHSLGHVPNQTMRSESAASLYKEDHATPSEKLITRHSAKRRQGKH